MPGENYAFQGRASSAMRRVPEKGADCTEPVAVSYMVILSPGCVKMLLEILGCP